MCKSWPQTWLCRTWESGGGGGEFRLFLIFPHSLIACPVCVRGIRGVERTLSFSGLALQHSMQALLLAPPLKKRCFKIKPQGGTLEVSCLSQLHWLFKNLSVKIPNAFWSEVVHECFPPEPLSPAPSPALCSPPQRGSGFSLPRCWTHWAGAARAAQYPWAPWQARPRQRQHLS